MNTFLITAAPVILVISAIVILFVWGAKGKSPLN
ncbi:cytochrome bd oxidase small subunit CydS [Metabacillus mangrovi]